MTGYRRSQECDARPAPYWKYGAQAAEVEVDPETGVVKVVSFAAAHDCGGVVNPLIAEGQAEGAASAGLAYALWDEMQFDGGRVTNPSFMVLDGIGPSSPSETWSCQ
ncbi:MAG: molybdopterin-dependent oxidoreductase, partial [Dehalococcoidia bacterium]|nr:molybdopterin-dependent oxidoreductase [Dehalococcoidia bacterium]